MNLNQQQRRRQINSDFINEMITNHQLEDKILSPSNTLSSSNMTDQIIKMFNHRSKFPSQSSPQTFNQDVGEAYTPRGDGDEETVITEIDNIIDKIKQKYNFNQPKQETLPKVTKHEYKRQNFAQTSPDKQRHLNQSGAGQIKNTIPKYETLTKYETLPKANDQENERHVYHDTVQNKSRQIIYEDTLQVKNLNNKQFIQGEADRQAKPRFDQQINNDDQHSIKNKIKAIQKTFKSSQKKDNTAVIIEEDLQQSQKKTTPKKSRPSPSQEEPHDPHFIQQADFTFQTPFRSLNYDAESNLSYSQSQVSCKNFSTSKSVDQLIHDDKILKELNDEESNLMRELQMLKHELQEIDS